MLLQADGGVVTPSELLDAVWEDPFDRSRSVVKVVVFALRRKLGLPPVIHTDAGLGYRIGRHKIGAAAMSDRRKSSLAVEFSHPAGDDHRRRRSSRPGSAC